MGIFSFRFGMPKTGRRRLGRLALRAFPAALVSLALVPAGGSAAGTNLLTNGGFEGTGSGSLAGWAGSGANLSLATDGHTGTFAAKVAYKGTGATNAMQTQPRPVTSTVAGTTYVADGFVRADATAKKACLKIKEFSSSGTVLGQTTNTCVVTSTAWQALPEISYTTTGSGGSIQLQVMQLSPAAGDSFETDDLSLAEPGTVAQPDPPGSVSATATSPTHVDVSWTAPAGVSVASYNVYRDGTLLRNVASGVTSIGDDTVQPDTTYTYAVSDVDGNGVESTHTAAAPVTTPAAPPPPPPPGGNLLSNGTFEGTGSGSLVGWGGAGGTLSLATDGHTGTFAAKVAYKGTGGTNGMQTQPRPVTSTVAGTTYVADGFARADTTRKKICLKLKEFNSAGTVVGQTTNLCITASAAWQALPEITYTTVQSGGSLVMQVNQLTPAAGDSFEADDLSLTAPDAGAPAPPTNVTATATAPDHVDVGWTPPGSTVAGFHIYRNGNLVGSVGGAATSFGDDTVAAGTTYTYAVASVNAGGAESARVAAPDVTTPATGGDPVIAAAGDIACDPLDANYNRGAGTASACRETAVSNLMVGAGLDAVLPLGDEQYECGGLSDFQTSYDSSWGRLNAVTYPVPGNHEYQATGGTGCSATGAGYYSYFANRLGNPVFPASASDPTKGYYSFDLGTWHIVALNSNSNCSTVGCGAGSPQEQWLKSDLAAHPTQCTLAYFHHPRFASNASGGTSSVSAFFTDLYNAGAELILNGHVHNYERFAPQTPAGAADPNGVREFVVGTGGKSAGGFGTVLPTSEVRAKTFGVLKLTLHPGSYDWKFLAAPGGTGSTFTDSGSTSCHQ